MIPEKLEDMISKCLEDKEAPFCVACTAGTTVLGKLVRLRLKHTK